MSTAPQGPRPGPRRSPPVGTVVRRLSSSYLVQFLVFVAVLLVVVLLLARQPEGCACGTEKAEIVLLALGGTLALVGTVLITAAEHGRERAGVAMIGGGVVLVAAAGLVGSW